MPDGTEDRKNLFVNPCKEIPAEVVPTASVDEDVKDAPTLKQLAVSWRRMPGLPICRLQFQPFSMFPMLTRIPARWN